MGELLQVFIETPFTVILALLGVAFIGIALIGEVPFIRFTGPISSRRSFAIGVFGMTLLASSFGMTFILAASTAPQSDVPPTEVAVSNTTTPSPDVTLVMEEPTRTPQSTLTLQTATEGVAPTDEAVFTATAEASPTSTMLGKCPSTAEAAADMFGGNAIYWKRLEGYEQYAWKYGPAPAAPITNFTIPEEMKGDWWDGYNAHSREGPAQGGEASEATIWCVP